jgi:hypothetical protein
MMTIHHARRAPRAGNSVIAPAALASPAHGVDARSTGPGSRRLVARLSRARLPLRVPIVRRVLKWQAWY